MLKLASWNVNSLTIRLEQVLTWLTSSAVSILAMQETKLIDDFFPKEEFTKRGYHVAYIGQKSYNGVALVSRYPLKEVVTGIAGFDDPQRRMIAATIGDLRLINLYVPNGSEIGSEKYHYKLRWLNQMKDYLASQLLQYPLVAVVGDFNVAPEDRDVYDPLEWKDCVLVSEPEREAFRALLTLGLCDSFRNFPQEEKIYSWWDYRAAAFRRNRGLRIDHILLNSTLNSLCQQSQIDKAVRKWERPSDHAPIWVELDLAIKV